MATVLPFSSINDHVRIKESSKKALLDTNVLLSFSHDTNIFHDDTLDVFSVFTPVNLVNL